MYNFVILTDNTVDMPVEWLNEHEVGYECGMVMLWLNLSS